MILSTWGNFDQKFGSTFCKFHSINLKKKISFKEFKLFKLLLLINLSVWLLVVLINWFGINLQSNISLKSDCSRRSDSQFCSMVASHGLHLGFKFICKSILANYFWSNTFWQKKKYRLETPCWHWSRWNYATTKTSQMAWPSSENGKLTLTKTIACE